MSVNSNNFVEDIKEIIVRGRNMAYGSVNGAMLATYWHIGKRIVEEEQKGAVRAEYGTHLLEVLSEKLTEKFGKGFSLRYLRDFRRFYVCFPDWAIRHTRVPNLTWAHYRCAMRVMENDIRYWYLSEASAEGWSVRTLDRNISSQYYERMLLSQAPEKVKNEMQVKTNAFQKEKLEFIKNPVVAEFLGLSPNSDYTESDLENSIITHIQKFLMEMGKGYAFVARQQHIRTEENDYFIDLVFYNYIMKCFVLIDLKTTRITHQDVGQMNMYVQMYDEFKRGASDNPTLGIILCADTDKDVAKYSVLHGNEQLFASKYKLILPDEAELRREIENQKEFYRLQAEDGE